MASEIKANKISPATGTAFTLGDSGDTFTLPSGATLSGAGAITVPSGGSLTINSGATITNNGTNGGGFGKVLQVVKGATSALFSTTSSSLVNSNVTVTITPSSASSIILLSYNAWYYRSGSGSGDGSISNRDITRDGTTIFSAFGGISRSTEADNGFIYDAPSTTSAVTYRLRIARASTYTANIPAGCYMTAIEIAV